MAKGKRTQGNAEKFDLQKRHELDDALKILKECVSAKFDETVEIAIKLGVDPKKSDQMVRGVVQLPNGSGREVVVLVFAKGEQEQAAKDAGADFVGAEDMVEKIKGGWLGFDKAIATPEMMSKVGPIAKILGPRGLMPNPKVGTVTKDVGKAVTEQKAGSVEFRVEKAGIIHAPVGKLSFEADRLKENILAVVDQVVRSKPAAAKGTFLQSMSLSSTMGPGIRLDAARTAAATGED